MSYTIDMEANRDDNSPRYRALMELLRTADSVWNASRIFFERWDLSPSQFNVLNLLRFNPDGLSQTDLSRELITHRSNVTGLVDRLEKRGLLTRQDVAGDRRAYRVVLTKAGEAVLREILPLYFEGANRVWDHISPKRAADLVKDLRQVAQNAGRIATELPQSDLAGSE